MNPPAPLANLDVQNLYYFILKSMNLFFIFLLIQIYKSDGYKKFLRTDLRAYLVMAKNYKGYIMAYFYNNRKMEKMIQIQQKKTQMYKQVKSLQDEVLKWRQAQLSVFNGFFSFGTRQNE